MILQRTTDFRVIKIYFETLPVFDNFSDEFGHEGMQMQKTESQLDLYLYSNERGHENDSKIVFLGFWTHYRM
jgi:hypothetical protein